MNYNLTPKEEYLQDSKQVADHRVLVENLILRRALKTALSQYERKLSGMQVADLGSGCMLFMKFQGAHEYLETLYNLCETTTPSSVPDPVNLPGNVRSLNKKG